MVRQKRLKKLAWAIGGISAAMLGIPAHSLQTSVGEAGIDARRLHAPPYDLIGRKIAIGAVDIGRPRQFGLDKKIPGLSKIPIARVFFQDGPPVADSDSESSEKRAEQHAEQVASVMVGTDKALTGVAPGAKLYAAGVGQSGEGGQAEECLAAQNLAEQNGGDLRAINFSFGESLRQDPRADAVLDGLALLTLCVDWSARTHDVLYAIAGNQGGGGIPIPTDNFNGVNVAFSTQDDKGSFSKVDLANVGTIFSGVFRRLIGQESNIDGRRLVALVAPGSNLELMTMDGRTTRTSGTSFATPHVTATVALLQEFGDRQIRQKLSKWTLDARRHEVMKAVLINSTDKIKDTGDGLRLEMTRDLLAPGKRNWLNSKAYQDPEVPLDGELGSGHLNAYRAYQQFSAGQWGPDAPVPPLGWDYRTVSEKSERDYILEQPLKQGSFVAITLAWDRLVELDDDNDNERYDAGENFVDRGLNDLDVYLMPADEDDTEQSVWSSVSKIDSSEHVFYRIPKTGRYKIRVKYKKRVNEEIQPYAIAWWTVPAR